MVTSSSSPRYKKLFSQGCRALVLTVIKNSTALSFEFVRWHSFPILLSTILGVSSFSPRNTSPSCRVLFSSAKKPPAFLFPRVRVPAVRKKFIKIADFQFWVGEPKSCLLLGLIVNSKYIYMILFHISIFRRGWDQNEFTWNSWFAWNSWFWTPGSIMYVQQQIPFGNQFFGRDFCFFHFITILHTFKLSESYWNCFKITLLIQETNFKKNHWHFYFLGFHFVFWGPIRIFLIL